MQVTEFSIRIRWGQHSDPSVQAYQVAIRYPGAVDNLMVMQYGRDEQLEHTFTGLTSGTLYEVSSQAILLGGSGPRNAISQYTSKNIQRAMYTHNNKWKH